MATEVKKYNAVCSKSCVKLLNILLENVSVIKRVLNLDKGFLEVFLSHVGETRIQYVINVFTIFVVNKSMYYNVIL